MYTACLFSRRFIIFLLTLFSYMVVLYLFELRWLPGQAAHDHRALIALREKAKITYERFLPCLKDTPHANVSGMYFPDDAHQHYKQLLRKTAKYRSGIPVHSVGEFSGPWIENLFIEKFISWPLERFNGFIPIFVQWVDLLVVEIMGNQKSALPTNTYSSLPHLFKNLLRDDVLYIVVSQSDVGIQLLHALHPNILVLSAGGFGHIPIPLIKDEIEPQGGVNRNFTSDIAFFGTLENHKSRQPTLEEVKRACELEHMKLNTGKTSNWLYEMTNARFNLAPRGFGRTSYRLTEAIQSNLVPIYTYDDVPWLPYVGSNLSLFEIGYVGRMGELHQVVKDLKNVSEHEYARKKSLIARARHSYTYQGVLEQIERLFETATDGRRSDLRCSRVPKTYN